MSIARALAGLPDDTVLSVVVSVTVCRAHWFRLPKLLRDQIWATYRLGQEIRKDPSPEYLAVARAVQEWIREHEARPVPQPREELRPPTGAER